MSTNPGVGGITTTTSKITTATITSSLSRRSHRPPSTHRAERLGVDFAIPVSSATVPSSAVATMSKTDLEMMTPSRSDAQSFSRMPSQRRRRLWTLAARAAARYEHPSQDKEAAVLSSGSQASKHLGESSTQSSSFLKPGTVRTQDSGISSMDYLTSREANSPNSEEASFRQRTSLSLGAAEHQPGVFRQPLQPPGPRWPPARTTKIVVSGEAPTLRYANYCSAYVPEWARRNWSSAPRPFISRQRSSMEVSYDITPDWAASMETLNMQNASYPHNRRLFYSRYGRASCPKANVFFEHSFPTVHAEESVKEVGKKHPAKLPYSEEYPEHLRRRRFNAPCWCDHPQMPLPPYHAPTSMLSPYFHCRVCPYRCLEPPGLVPIRHPHQCDLGQRHIRRLRLKRMSSEPTPPTWMANEGEVLLAPAKRRPPPEPLSVVTSPPPIPRKVNSLQQQPNFLSISPPSEGIHLEPRIITSTPRTDVYLMTSEGAANCWRRRRGGDGSLIRGRSVDDAFYSPRWDRQSSFLSDPRRPTYINEEQEVMDYGPPYRHYSRLESEPIFSDGLSHPQFRQPWQPGATFGIRPSSCRSAVTGSTAWFLTSPRCVPLLRPRSEGGSRPTHICALRHFRGQGLRGTGPSISRVQSAASSLEISEAATSGLAPPWQLTSSPLSTTSRSILPRRRKICRSGEVGVGAAAVGVGDAESTLGARKKRRHLTALPRNVDTTGHQRELDVKWKRKSFRRSNGYDAADVIDRTPSTCVEQMELLPSRREALSAQPSAIRTTATIVHESHEEDEKNRENRVFCQEDTSVIVTTPPVTSSAIVATDSRDLEAGFRKCATPLDHDANADSTIERQSDDGDEDESDKDVASAVHPPNTSGAGTLSGHGSGSLPRAQKTINQGILVGGTVARGSELAILGFTNHNDYWEHPAFGRSRITAIVIAFLAIFCLLFCFVATTWVYSGVSGNMTHRGLWRKCSIVNSSCEITIPFISETDGWQGAATCILLVAIFIGLIGTGLAIFGHSGSDLVKRLYYFHSSGEIFFLAGFTTFLTFGIYRSYANLNLLNSRQPNPQTTPIHDPHHLLITNTTATSSSSTISASKPRWQIYYGTADIVGWCGGVLFMASAIALQVDEFLHELARLGHTGWPNLARFLHSCAVHVTASNRSMRNFYRRCLLAVRRGTTSSSLTKAPVTTAVIAPVEPISYRPTTGANVKQHRRWRLRRQ